MSNNHNKSRKLIKLMSQISEATLETFQSPSQNSVSFENDLSVKQFTAKEYVRCLRNAFKRAQRHGYEKQVLKELEYKIG